MLKYAQAIPVSPSFPCLTVVPVSLADHVKQSESIVLVEGIIKEAEVKSCTIQEYEISIRKLYTEVQVEVPELPFSIDDASRPESDFQRVSLSGFVLPRDRFVFTHCRRGLADAICRWRPRTFSFRESR